MRGKFLGWLINVSILIIILATVGAFVLRQVHLASLQASSATPAAPTPPVEEAKVLKLSPEARKNLGLVSKPVSLQTYWRTIQIPGMIVDRPGISDRGITAPAVGIITQVHAFPGDTVQPGQSLFTFRMFSEYLQNTQSELFKAQRETELIQEQLDRLKTAAETGAIAGVRIIEFENQLRRQEVLIQAYHQDLLTRGLNPKQIEEVMGGKFVSTVEIPAPPPLRLAASSRDSTKKVPSTSEVDLPTYEVQDLHVELGQQVQAGQLLGTLSNHQSLYIEGRAFKRDAAFLEQAAQNQWPIDVEFTDDDNRGWPTMNQTFQIHHLANAIEPQSRTFDFFIPLDNQAHSYQQAGQTFAVWRFRPGQRVRLQIPVEEIQDAIVLPAAAVVREGPEAYVFQQNGDLFNRIPVHVLHEDRLDIVLANKGGVAAGFYLAQGSAAALNRVLKAQAASGVRADVHVHADGTVHGSH